MKLREKVCKAPGCTNKHKGFGSFCVEHAHLADQQVTAVQRGSKELFNQSTVRRRAMIHGGN